MVSIWCKLVSANCIDIHIFTCHVCWPNTICRRPISNWTRIDSKGWFPIETETKFAGFLHTYTLPGKVLIFTCSILIPSCVGWAGANPPTYKKGTFFLMPLAFSVSIFNKTSHRTRAVETFKFLPKFESFHSSCLMRFFLENWHTKSQGHNKNCPHFTRRRVCPCPSHSAGN